MSDRSSGADCGNAHGQVAHIYDDKSKYEEIDEPQYEVVNILLEGLRTDISGREALELGGELAEDNGHQWQSSARNDSTQEGYCV